jgi:phospholipid/cholesterol/gamma-HCH transport system substrate-binding protein
MATAIRKSLRDFIAVSLLLILALGVTVYILENQRLRIPIFEEKPFELKAEFQTAQAVVPGQGQSIRVAGVKIGDVSDVNVENGVGVVTFAIDRKYLPIYEDATVLMRPTTALKDMFFDLDPGTRAAGDYEEGDTIPAANTAPDVNLDEILAALDSDTQAYLKLLLIGA